jgi:phosphoribosylformylglycinamidine synthase II
VVEVFLVNNLNLEEKLAVTTFSDPVSQNAWVDRPAVEHPDWQDWVLALEVAYKPGVTNPLGITAKEALSNALGALPPEALIQTAHQYLFQTNSPLSDEELAHLESHLHNNLIEKALLIQKSQWQSGKRFPEEYPYIHDAAVGPVRTIPLTEKTGDQLVALSKEMLLALSLEEMQAIQNYYAAGETRAERTKHGLPSEPTDVELEMLAQTWSEHCKHKIFAANIDYKDLDTGETQRIESLFNTYIKKTTEDLWEKRPFLRSVFHDNSGVIAFDEKTLVCFKAETHNSPSALDPYGGAITGIVGVNRDILGTGKGAKPIFNTNVLCFGDPNSPEEDIPKGLLHPRQVMEGVHKGIVDGGNHSGIPTVGGGFVFDESFKGKPLVFCGTGGIIPAEILGEEGHINHIEPGDAVVMVGGRIGKDGIHGATFSSLALDEESPTSAVQIGDPITQKKMTDFLLEARDLGLYKGITDNGAGGISSSLGEMAETSGGVRIDLHKCPLKYQGLAPWEILVSESQERMSLSVDPARLEEFLALSAKRGVESTEIGRFTDEGTVELRYGDRIVGLLSLDFLHDGVPKMQIPAEWKAPRPTGSAPLPDFDPNEILLRLLADPTITSKENLVRQYDHEVQARSVIKPFTGIKMDGPTDGAVLLVDPESPKALSVTHGIYPRYSDCDTYDMAMCAVDEAYRAHIALGGHPDQAAALDNFCWPDPILSEACPDGPYKMAQLVRANQGLRKACMDYGLPLISGKDSMKNDAVLDGKKVSIRPTLLISLMGILEDRDKAMTTDFLRSGEAIYILGTTNWALGGSSLEKILGKNLGSGPKVDTQQALSYYRKLAHFIQGGQISSIHDLSDGGLGVALAESALGGCLGANISLDNLPKTEDLSPSAALFSESPSRFLVSIPQNLRSSWEETFGEQTAYLGETIGTAEITITLQGATVVNLTLAALESAWKSLR